jgi:PEP-CTERM motif
MRMSNRFLVSAAAVAALFAGTAAKASVPMLSGTITADNEYAAFLSTSDSTLGTYLTSGANWQSAQSFSADLEPAQTYYLHVIANNWYGPSDMNGGNPDALLGSFAVTGPFQFANGQQTLDTDTTDWRADPNAVVQNLASTPLTWTAPSDTPWNWGNNGSSIWESVNGAPIAGISTQAQWIWSQTDPAGEAFFSTTITDQAGGVPEPAAWALMIVGFGLTGAALRRRRIPALARI